MNRAFLVLGSNIDAARNLPAAVALLRERGRVVRTSRVYESPPVDGSLQPNYLNAAVLLETPLGIRELREPVIAEIEQRLGRERDPANRYAARTIDIDVALFNREVAEIDGRPVPDPDILVRPFVAVPLAELDGDFVHPGDGRMLAQIAAGLDREGLLLRDDVQLGG